MNRINFNSNQFTPLSKEVKEAMNSAVEKFADSNPTGFGCDYKIEAETEEIKGIINEKLNANSFHLSFTNGTLQAAIELINLSVLLLDVKLVVTSVFEDEAKLKYIRQLKEAGKVELYLLKTSDFGEIDLEDLKNILAKSELKTLISLSHVNSFSGVLLPVKDIAALAKQHNALFYLDSSLMIGKYELDLSRIDIDFLSFDASLINGPVGVGSLFVNESLAVSNEQFGKLEFALQSIENKNVVLVLGFKHALLRALENINNWQEKVIELKSYFVAELETKHGLNTLDHFLKKKGLFNQLAFFAPKEKFGKYLIEKLDLNGFIVSKKYYPLKLNNFLEHHFVNISIPINSTKQEIDAFLNFVQNSSQPQPQT